MKPPQKPSKNSSPKTPRPDFSVNPHEYKYGLTGFIVFNKILVSPLDRLYAFCGDECRGVGSVLYFPPTRKNVFLLYLYSNQISGETISFKYYSAKKRELYGVNERKVFRSDEIYGKPHSPAALTIIPIEEI